MKFETITYATLLLIFTSLIIYSMVWLFTPLTPEEITKRQGYCAVSGKTLEMNVYGQAVGCISKNQ